MPKIRGIKPDFWTDEDIVELSIPARLLFIGLWTYACDNGHLQDKPKQIKMRVFPGDDVSAAELLRELAEANRIQRVAGWITVPNFTRHQKPDRRYFQVCDAPGCLHPKDSQPETRGGHHEHPTSTHRGPDVVSRGPLGEGDGEGEGEGDGEGDTSRELTLHEAPRADVERICEHLAARVEANGAKKPSITAKWRTAARLMLDADDRPEEHVHAAIDWCQSDEFWRANILSVPKLREKYDQLLLQAQRGPRTGTRNQEQRSLLERAMERAQEREERRMTPTEAVRLTGYIQAHFPSQPINEFTPDALGELLADYPAADCHEAVLNIAARGEEWCPPAKVAEEVKRIRTKRIVNATPPTPPEGMDADDVAGDLAWLAAERQSVADGNQPTEPPALPKRDLSALKSLIRRVPELPAASKDERDPGYAAGRAAAEADLAARAEVPMPDDNPEDAA